MTKSPFPAGWDEQRVRALIAKLDAMTDEEWVAEDEAAANRAEKRAGDAPDSPLRPRWRGLRAPVQGGASAQTQTSVQANQSGAQASGSGSASTSANAGANAGNGSSQANLAGGTKIDGSGGYDFSNQMKLARTDYPADLNLYGIQSGDI